MVGQRTAASAYSQVLLAVVAHVAVGGCLASLSTLLLAVPASAAAVLCTTRGLRSLGPFARLLAGQAAVHVVLGVAARCASHGADHGTAATGGATEHLAMAAVHLLVTALCLQLVGRCEEALSRAVAHAHAVVRSALRRPATAVGSLSAPAHPVPRSAWPTVRTALSAERAAQRGLRGPPVPGVPLFA